MKPQTEKGIVTCLLAGLGALLVICYLVATNPDAAEQIVLVISTFRGLLLGALGAFVSALTKI